MRRLRAVSSWHDTNSILVGDVESIIAAATITGFDELTFDQTFAIEVGNYGRRLAHVADWFQDRV
jgi:hypothetical protein